MFTWLLRFNLPWMHSHLQPDQLFTQYFPFMLKSCYLAGWKKIKTLKRLWFNSSFSIGFVMCSGLSDMLCPHWLYCLSDHNPQSMAFLCTFHIYTFSGGNSYTRTHFRSGVKTRVVLDGPTWPFDKVLLSYKTRWQNVKLCRRTYGAYCKWWAL